MRSMLDSFAKHAAEDAVDAFSSDALVSAEHLRGQAKKRRIDEDYVDVVHLVVGQGAARTTGAGVRCLRGVDVGSTKRWDETRMAAYQAATKLQFHELQSVGLCFDAKRLGEPAEETLMITIADPTRDLSAWLPPQVVRPITMRALLVSQRGASH